jgi:hypothetical protein
MTNGDGLLNAIYFIVFIILVALILGGLVGGLVIILRRVFGLAELFWFSVRGERWILIEPSLWKQIRLVMKSVFASPLSASTIDIPRYELAQYVLTSSQGLQPRRDLPTKTVPVSPTFKLVFLTIVGITLFAATGEVALAAMWLHPTLNQQSAFEALNFTWKAGIGAIFGLLGGKLK